MDFSAYGRISSGNPSLSCSNKNDSFTVSNGIGNKSLRYPVALLTADEVVLAGGKYNENSSFYLNYNNSSFAWLLTPSVNSSGQYVYRINTNYGKLFYDSVSYRSDFLPSVSLKFGTQISLGTGTVTDPYVIE
jgi:hypothetical protein